MATATRSFAQLVFSRQLGRRNHGRLARAANKEHDGGRNAYDALAMVSPGRSEEARGALRRELWQSGMLVLRMGEVITAAELEAFGRATFGQAVLQVNPVRDQKLPEEFFSPAVQALGNPMGLVPLAAAFQAERRRGTHSWHVDKQPVPKGGEADRPYVVMIHMIQTAFPGHTTSFADMQSAYAGLGDERREWWSSRRMWHLDPYGGTKDASKRALHPLVRRHAFSDVPCLQVGPSQQRSILEGMDDEVEEAQDDCWETLVEEAMAAGEVYHHVWERGDLVIFDNSQLLHRSNPYDASVDVRNALRLGVACDQE